jgi:hypothetical protein
MPRADFEERRLARIERLEQRAVRRQRLGESMVATANQRADVIPLGQPILVGHYSEGRDRRYREKIRRGFERGYALQREAEQLSRRAAVARANRSISSDDPNAVARLKEKLEGHELTRAVMKAVNAAIRKAKGDAAKVKALVAASGHKVSDAEIAELLKPDCFGRVGFAPYQLSNLGSEISRVKARIAELERRAARGPTPPQQFGDIEVRREDNRVQIVFPGKPTEEKRTALKRAGFRWAPSVGAWQKHESDWAHHEAVTLAQKWSQP